MRKLFDRESGKLIKSYLFFFILLFVSGLPWLIAYWPGTLQFDSCGQLLQYLGVGRMTGHHPYPVTMLMGITLSVGRKLFHFDNAGIFIYIFMQFLVQCLVVAYALYVLKKRIAVPIYAFIPIVLFYTVFPLIPNWGISYGKDTGYYICFLLFVTCMLDIYFPDNGDGKLWKKLLHVCATVGLVLFRNDGRYVVLISLFVLLVFYKKQWKTIVATVAFALCMLFLVEGICMPVQKIPKGSVREALSVPLLQTAGYVKTYPEEITEGEEQVLKQVFRIETKSQLADAYDSEISDPVKDLFLEYPTKGELLQYVKLWFRQFLKHPFLYVKLFWNHCSGYFNPFEVCYDNIVGWFKILDGEERVDEYLNIHFYPQTKGFRGALESWVDLLVKLPITALLFRPACYTWCLFIVFLLSFRKIDKKITYAFVPPFIVLLVCMFSPLNGSIRYFLPVMVTLPIYFGLCFKNHE